MAFWNRQRSNDTTPYWRDTNGAIVCKGDNCVMKKCGDDCPIWLNTQGITLAKLNEHDKAIEAYEQALRIAPDFVDAWNNMAAIYGLTGKYEKARDAYKKAYELGHRANALYGLALANRDCGNKEEAIRCCEEYRAKFPDGRLDKVYEKLMADSPKAESTKDESGMGITVSILKVLLSEARRSHFTNSAPDSFPNIPEIMALAADTCEDVLVAVSEKLKKCNPVEAMRYNPLTFCGFAGVGAVRLWNQDWPSLKANGVYQSLSAGGNLDLLENKATSVQYSGRNARQMILRKGQIETVAFACKNENDKYVKQGYRKEDILFSCCEAMYLFGMVYGMEMIGLK